MKRLLALFVLLLGSSAWAQPCIVGAHLATWHVKPGFEAATVGLYAQACNGFTVGALRNSEGRGSVYAGKTWSTASGSWSLTAGAITGYSTRAVNPMLVPSYSRRLDGDLRIRVSFLPRSYKGGSSALHLSLEKSL